MSQAPTMRGADFHEKGIRIMRKSAGKLTPMQRRILSAMANDDLGFAAFNGDDSRKSGFGTFPAKGGGIIIRAMLIRLAHTPTKC